MPRPPKHASHAPHDLPLLLQKEVAPFGADEIRTSGAPLVDNPDPVLSRLSDDRERTYSLMRRAEPRVRSAIGQRTSTLLAPDSVVRPGSAGNRDAKDLADFAISYLKNIRMWGGVVQHRVLDAVYDGWRPLNLIWTNRLQWRGGEYWGVSDVREKQPGDFQFTAIDRHLAYVGDIWNTDPVIYDGELDHLRWWVCTSGSTDNPYGEAVLRDAWLTYYIKSRFLEMWSTGMQRSMGILQAKAADAAAGFSGQLDAMVRDPDGSKHWREEIARIAEELREIIAVMSADQALVSRPGWVLELLSDVDYADGWNTPLEYLDQALTLVLLHQTLTTSLDGQGARAATETHREGLLDVAKSGDGRQLRGWVGDLLEKGIVTNFGEVPADLMPKFCPLLGEEIEPSLVSALTAAGVQVDWGEISDRWGVPVIRDPETGEVQMIEREDEETETFEKKKKGPKKDA